MAYKLSPVWNATQFFDNDGMPLSGGKIFQYTNGSFTTHQTTYADNVGYEPNPNPIVLDSSGFNTAPIWLVVDSVYTLVLKMPDGETILQTVTGVERN